jgi:hypothetical protein
MEEELSGLQIIKPLQQAMRIKNISTAHHKVLYHSDNN